VTVSCTTANDQECEDLESPAPLCAMELRILTLVYDGVTTCDNDNNNQDDSYCEDIGSLSSQVNIACQDSDADDPNVIFTASTEPVSVGDLFTIVADPLPDRIICRLSDSVSNDPVQIIEIDIASDPLYLKDQYGALEVTGCGGKVCIVDAEITYEVTNEGSASFTISNAVRTLGESGDEQSFLEDLQLVKDTVEADQTVFTTEEITLDLCTGQPIFVSATVTASPDDGEDCKGEDVLH